jgi:hypothetical protein
MFAAVVAAGAIALVILIGNGGGGSDSGRTPSHGTSVEPVPAASDPGERARNLADWLREHSR